MGDNQRTPPGGDRARPPEDRDSCTRGRASWRSLSGLRSPIAVGTWDPAQTRPQSDVASRFVLRQPGKPGEPWLSRPHGFASPPYDGFARAKDVSSDDEVHRRLQSNPSPHFRSIGPRCPDASPCADIATRRDIPIISGQAGGRCRSRSGRRTGAAAIGTRSDGTDRVRARPNALRGHRPGRKRPGRP
jgi:hypothetical protein